MAALHGLHIFLCIILYRIVFIIIRITPIWSKLTKSLHPFTGQAMGDISGIAILFRRAINYILSGDQIYEGTCERLWKSQLAVGFDRDVSFGEIFGCLRICITSISCPLPQLVSWSVGRVEVEIGRVEWASEFLRYRVLKLRANETYEMGEKHTNRTRPVRKIILRIMHSLMFNRTKVARVVQSPKRALITSSSSDPGPLLHFLSDGWTNVFYQMVVSDPCHS